LVLDRYKLAKGLDRKLDIRHKWGKEALAQLGSDPLFIRSTVDYIAGMTDRFAIREYDQLYSAYPRTEL
jgi:dGTP triphosphohydrolase